MYLLSPVRDSCQNSFDSPSSIKSSLTIYAYVLHHDAMAAFPAAAFSSAIFASIRFLAARIISSRLCCRSDCLSSLLVLHFFPAVPPAASSSD